MRSAYGRQTPPPDYELTCVEPGSPMGELLRRYWQPVCTSDELNDLPKKVRLLCEELVVSRDKKGRVGALEPHCSTRLASRLSQDGIWRAGVLYGPARHRTSLSDVRHHRYRSPQRCRAAWYAPMGRVCRRLCQRLQLAVALREHRRSVASADAAPNDQPRPVRGSVDAGCSAHRVRAHRSAFATG